jgi:hypothetical protein
MRQAEAAGGWNAWPGWAKCFAQPIETSVIQGENCEIQV